VRVGILLTSGKHFHHQLPEEMGVLDKLMEIVSINRKNKTKVSKNCNTNVIHKIVILM
jgi:hypothetical protein